VSISTDTAPLLISVKAAAARSGLSIDEVYDYVKAGEIAFIQKAPGARIHILAADLDRWVTEAATARLAQEASA
jgi:excisionase family DNA binding protein